MKPYYADDTVTLYCGDALEVLRSLPDASVDAVVTDPPYGLEFMGKDWDRFAGQVTDRDFKGFVLSQQRTRNVKCPECGKWAYDHPGRLCECGGVRRAQGSAFQRWCEQWAVECLRVLKPGGHLLAFGGTRTVHRLTTGIEDAGFEIRDGIDWLYASGFPKSLDVSKAIDKAAGAERELTRPGRVEYGGLGEDWAVGPHSSQRPRRDTPATDDAAAWSGWGTALKPAREPIVMARKPLAGTVAANVAAHGTGALNIDATRVGTTRAVPASHSRTPSSIGATGVRVGEHRPDSQLDPNIGRWPSNVVLSHAPDCGEPCVPGCPVAELDRQSGSVGANPVGRLRRAYAYRQDGQVPSDQPFDYGDSGGASRFFPVFRYEAKAPTAERPRTPDGTAHPTVKPLDLMRWLVRLVTPPGGVVLEPFAGSGTTAEACVLEGFRCIAIEREAAYLPLIVARLTKPLQPSLDLFGAA